MNEMILTLNNPLTEEQWDAITDVDFDHTEHIMFTTKHGKEVEFIKLRRGKWTTHRTRIHDGEWYCSVCDYEPTVFEGTKYCPNCGARMDLEDEE